MKSFLKYTLATVFGVFIAFLMLGVLLFFTVVGLVSSKANQTTTVKDNSVLELQLDYTIPERSQADFLSLFSKDGEIRYMGLDKLLAVIEQAKNDPKIKGVLMHTNLNGTGYASIQEIRNALLELKSKGKFIYTTAPYYDEKNYYLASVADSIFIEPTGNILLNGLSANIMFYTGALEKLGVEMQYVKVGAYKGAIEAFTRKELSPENKLQITAYLNDIYHLILNDVSKSRHIDTAVLHKAMSQFEVQSPRQAIALGLIDRLAYTDQIHNSIKRRLKLKPTDELAVLKAGVYAQNIEDQDEEKDKIAVVYAVGEIVDGEGDQDNIGSISMSKAIAKAREDQNVKAIVLRVNSPGGSSLASDIIAREIALCKGVKPVVVSMNDVAASGGYYISALADSIIAMPATITGSIGVFGLFPNMHELLVNKMGLTFETVKTGLYSDFGRVDQPLSETDRAYLQSMVNRIYDDFTGIVEKGRGLDSAHVESIAQGHVWTAGQALNNGLVDSYGGIQKAIEIAAYLGKLKQYSLSTYPKIENPLELIFNQGTEALAEQRLKSELGVFYNYYKGLQQGIKAQGFQMRLPFDLQID